MKHLPTKVARRYLALLLIMGTLGYVLSKLFDDPQLFPLSLTVGILILILNTLLEILEVVIQIRDNTRR